MNRLRTAAHRAPIFLGLGSVLATGAVAPGCRDAGPSTQAADLLPEKGVRTLVSEVAPGEFVIDEETLVDTSTHVIVRRLNGTEERITDPDRFSALLVSPDSARALAALSAPDTSLVRRTAPVPAAGTAPTGGTPAANGGGDSWDGGSTPAPSSGEGGSTVRTHTGGFPLGTLLFYSLAMNAWRPRAYQGVYAAPPRGAYRDDNVRQRSGSAGSGLLAAQRAGQAPASLDQARTRSVARARAASPSGGRSGFGRTFGRSGG